MHSSATFFKSACGVLMCKDLSIWCAENLHLLHHDRIKHVTFGQTIWRQMLLCGRLAILNKHMLTGGHRSVYRMLD